MSAINIYYQNVRGLRTKTSNLLRNVCINNYDIIVLTETWLVDSVSNSELFDSRYFVWRRDRDYGRTAQTRGGGVLMAVKNDLTVMERCEWRTSAEDIWVSIVLKRSRPAAVMKIVKHCHEESCSNMEVAQGALLGLVVENRLEITNCFPFPKHDDTMDEEEYQLDMMRRLRRVNVDHFHVGWYQSADVGNFLSQSLLESQYHYQTSIEESVVVIYDTKKSARGFLTLKAYRLTPQAIAMYKEGDYTPEALRNLKIGYESLFIEVPIVIRNSPLTNIMMSELSEMIPEEEGSKFLDLGTASVLEGQLRSLMERVDELNQEAIKFNRYQQLVVRQQQDKHRWLAKRTQENLARAAKDEPPLPEEDMNKLFKPHPVPPRLNPMIVAGQINTYSQHISQFCSQSLAKLYLTQALQNAKESKQNN